MGDGPSKINDRSSEANNNQILPEEMYSRSIKVASAIGSGLLDGTVNKLGQYTSHAMHSPFDAARHIAEGAAIGVGLALANRKLAAVAGVFASGEMLFRAGMAASNSSETIMNLASTGTGYEQAKKSISCNFGQLSADLLVISATGLVAGGATHLGVKAFKPKATAQKSDMGYHSDFSRYEKGSFTWGYDGQPKSKAKLTDLDVSSTDDLLTTLMAHNQHLANKKLGNHENLSYAAERLIGSSGRSNLKFITDTPPLHGNMTKNELFAALNSDMRTYGFGMKDGMSRIIGKFSHGMDGEYQKMTPTQQCAMIDNLSAIAKEVNAKRPVDYASNLESLAMVHRFGNRRGQEIELLEESLKILDSSVVLTPIRLGQRSDKYALASTLESLANAFVATGQREKAIGAARRLVNVNEAVMGPFTGQSVKAIHQLADVCHQVGERDQSLTAFIDAAESFKRMNADHVKFMYKPFGSALSKLHQSFLQSGEARKAAQCLELIRFWKS